MTDPVWSVLAEVVLKHTPCLPASHARVKEALGWVVVVGVCGCQLLAAVVVELQRALQAAAVQGEKAHAGSDWVVSRLLACNLLAT